MGLFSMSASIYEPVGQVGRVTFAPPLDSKSEREALANRLNRQVRNQMKSIQVKMLDSYTIETPLASEKALPLRPPNPDPSQFVIERLEEVDTHCLAMVRYLGCTNYEGRKVLVFRNANAYRVRSAKVLDPHFTDQASSWALVPVARFEPTETGWKLARVCAAAL